MRQADAAEQDLGLVGFILDTIDTLGELGVGLLVLLESVIPPIPSEIVLPAAGALIELGRLNGPLTWLAALLGSVLGALILYGAGRAFGEQRTRRVLLAVPLVESDDVDRADAWFARRGELAVFVGRLIPGVRSLISLPAGAAGMPLGKFVLLTAAGSAIWNSLLIGAGVLLGTQWQRVEEHIDVINDLIYVTIGVSIGVFFMRRWAHRRRQARAGDA
ncbi:MAG: DedA family protein [Candidatus Nanopelagicales bacterium]|jgi:membrane protein DedA with SNARE-associated domain|nr:DedA family protein [Candidatus Nanopelagicales bacterium]